MQIAGRCKSQYLQSSIRLHIIRTGLEVIGGGEAHAITLPIGEFLKTRDDLACGMCVISRVLVIARSRVLSRDQSALTTRSRVRSQFFRGRERE